MTRLARGLVTGAAAGAAGTTGLNAVTYLDMVLRARPASSTPADTVERLMEKTPLEVPGEGETRENRVSALGALTGIAAGLGTGAVLGVARAGGWRAGPAVTFTAAAALVLLAGNAPMTLLRVTDPRTWGASDWVSDIVPHLAYAAVATAVVRGLDPD